MGKKLMIFLFIVVFTLTSCNVISTFGSNLNTTSTVKKSNLKWIPAEVLEFNGSSEASQYFSKYEKNFTHIHWDQNKIDELWSTSYEIYNNYGIQVDPRFLLAIIIQEGTGSFNTSSTNLAVDGQHGVEKNFAVDLMKANSLVFGKVLGYIYYGKSFRQAVSKNSKLPGINGKASIFQYCNWYTPIIDIYEERIRLGQYAGDGSWGDGVKEHYILLGGNADKYNTYLLNIGTSPVRKIAKNFNIELSSFAFKAEKNAQNHIGELNGKWTIVAKK